jgi:hypothetical protein
MRNARERRMMRPGLSCRVVSRPVVSYRVSWTCALVVVVGRPSFARVCFTRINHDYASIRFFHSGLRYVTNSTLTHARQTPRRASRYAPAKGISCPAFGVESEGGRSSACVGAACRLLSRANKTPYSGLEGRYYYCSVYILVP